GNSQLGASRRLAVEPDHGAPGGSLRADDPRRCSRRVESRADGEALRLLARLLDHERAVEPVRTSNATDGNAAREAPVGGNPIRPARNAQDRLLGELLGAWMPAGTDGCGRCLEVVRRPAQLDLVPDDRPVGA